MRHSRMTRHEHFPPSKINMPFGPAEQQALEADFQVLKAILYRNRASHARTKYFQRLFMVLQRQTEVTSFLSDFQTYYQREEAKQKTNNDKWSLEENHIDQEEMEQQDCLFRTLTKTLPDLVPRCEHAANALVPEISRGFFLPLNMVCLGAVARIRQLVINLGLHAIEQALFLPSNKQRQPLLQQIQRDYFIDTIIQEENSTGNSALDVTLRQLGITLGNTKQVVAQRNGSKTQRTETNQSLRGAMPQLQQDIQDIGKSIQDASCHPSSSQTTPIENHDVDANEGIRRQLQQKKKRQKDADNTHTGENMKKKIKRKKSSRKTDFFDNLFGT